MNLKQALRHTWLSGKSATDHNLLPEIRAYMAKARLRRGIEIIKLSNRIESLRMQEDSGDEASETDIPKDSAKAAAAATLTPGELPERAKSPSREKKSLSKIAKGAIFREVVLAKVREMKEQEQALKVESEALEKDAKRRSFQADK